MHYTCMHTILNKIWHIVAKHLHDQNIVTIEWVLFKIYKMNEIETEIQDEILKNQNCTCLIVVQVGNSEQLKITFVIAHQIVDRILCIF